MDTRFRFPTTPAAVKARPLKLRRKMSAEQAWVAIADNCCAQISANAAGVAQYNATESLHQMRVGLRRLRSALDMLRDVLALPAALRVDLDWLAAELGPARDWDVLAETTLARLVQAHPEVEGLVTLQQAALAEAGKLHQAAAAAAGSARYRACLQAFDAWVAARQWREGMLPADIDKLEMPASRLAAALIGQAQERLRKRGRDQGDAAARHRLRIAAKKARYATEFFASLGRQGRVDGFVRDLTGLQDTLGRLNDDAVAERLTAALAQDQPALAGSAGFVRGYLAADAERQVAVLGKRWKRFAPARQLF